MHEISQEYNTKTTWGYTNGNTLKYDHCESMLYFNLKLKACTCTLTWYISIWIITNNLKKSNKKDDNVFNMHFQKGFRF